MLKNINCTLLIIILSLLFLLTLSATDQMTVSPTLKYVNSGTITVDTSQSYNLLTPATWSPLTYVKTYPSGIQGQSSYVIAMSLVDLRVGLSSNRIQFAEVRSSNKTAFTLQISSALANYIQRISYRFFIVSGTYVSPSNFVMISLSWNYNSNVVSTASPNPAYYTLSTPLNMTGKIISYCFINEMNVNSTNQNLISFFVTTQVTSQTNVNFYLNSTSNIPTYVYSFKFDFLAFNADFYNQKNYASFSYGMTSIQFGRFSLTHNYSENCNSVTLLGLNGFTIQGDLFLDFSFDLSQSNQITVSSDNTNNTFKLFSLQYVTMLTYYCNIGTPYLNILTNICYDICPIRTFSDSSTLSCLACLYDCYTCNYTHCLTCNTADDFRVFDYNSSRCVPISGYFDNSITVCSKCSSNCLKCVNLTNCVNCAPETYLSNGVCNQCPSGCKTCISSSQCQSCNPGYSLASNFLCYKTCSSSQYFSLSTLACQSCPKDCPYCLSPTTCTDCSNGTYLFVNTSTSTCLNCSSNCVTCSNFSACTSCKSDGYLINSTCYSCSSNQYLTPNFTCELKGTMQSKSSGMPVGIGVGVAIGGFFFVIIFCIYQKCKKPEPRASEIYRIDNGGQSVDVINIQQELSTMSAENQWHIRAISVSTNKDCSICLMEQAFFKTKCGHSFHFMCIMQWDKKRGNCPNCREQLNHSKHKIYCRRCHAKYKVLKFDIFKEIMASRRQETVTVCEDCRLVPI